MLFNFVAFADVTLTKIESFHGTDGSDPQGQLLLADNGLFYGTAMLGGDFNQGVVFTATTSGQVKKLVSFNGANGAQPVSGLIQGRDGLLYGTTSSGGDFGLGTVFSLTKEGNLNTIASFDGTNGARPLSPILLGMDGNYYGATSLGGAFNVGTLFSVGTGSGLTNLFSFANTNGAQPAGNLAQVNLNTLYGTTSAGGTFGYGTVFAFPIGGVASPLYSFTGATDGAGPQGGLVQSGGVFYGTTAAGGTNVPGHGTSGTIFRIDSVGTFSSLHRFSGSDGSVPFSALFAPGNGMLYGTATAGGAYNAGTAFSVTTAGAFTNLVSFSGSGGRAPFASLTPGTNGNFFGVTSSGGNTSDGVLYQLSGFSPFFILQPTNQTVLSGDNVTLSVLVAGTRPFTFQWQFNSNNLANGHNVSGARTSTLTLTSVTPSNSGPYTVLVQNSIGQTLSATAFLSVIPRPAIRITSPRPNSVVNKTVINVTGSTGGDTTVARVYYQILPGGSEPVEGLWQPASTRDNWKHWSATVSVGSGSYRLAVFAESVIGTYSHTNTVAFSVPPFVPIQGNYYGLFLVPTNTSASNSGFFQLKLSANGSFSASLQSAGGKQSFSGKFDLKGDATGTLRRARQSPLLFSLHLDLNNPLPPLTGAISNADWAANLSAYRPAFNSKTNPAPFAGHHTFSIPGSDDPSLPQGDGYGTVSIDNSGRITLAAVLADNTKLTQSVPISMDGAWPLFASLYSGRGSILGWMSFTNPPPSNLSGELTWGKPAMASAIFYPAGFTGYLMPSGGAYQPPTNGISILGVTNAQIILSGADLSQGVTNRFKIDSHNHVTSLGSAPLTLTFSPTTGSFNGTVTDQATARKLHFQGVIRQDLSLGLGFFLGTNQTGTVVVEPLTQN